MTPVARETGSGFHSEEEEKKKGVAGGLWRMAGCCVYAHV